MAFLVSKLLKKNEVIARGMFRLEAYNKYGLYHDDLLGGYNNTVNPVISEAYRRIQIADPDLHDQRVFRGVRACQVQISKNFLPEDQWTTWEEDQTKGRYLKKYVEQIEKELEEKKRIEAEDAV